MSRRTGGEGFHGARKTLHQKLCRLRSHACQPSLGKIAKATGVPKTTVHRIFTSPERPNLEYLLFVVEYLTKSLPPVVRAGVDPEEMQRYFHHLFTNIVNEDFPDDPDAPAVGPVGGPWPLGPSSGGGARPLPGAADESCDDGEADPGAPDEPAGDVRVRSRVLLVGVTRYLGSAIVAALTALARLLADPRRGPYPGGVELLIDPTREQLWRALHAAAGTAEDTFIVYFAGHGYAGADRSYLAMADSTCEHGIADNLLGLDDLRQLMAAAPARRRALVLDWLRLADAGLIDVTPAPGALFAAPRAGASRRAPDAGAYLLMGAGDRPGAITAAISRIAADGERYETLASLHDALLHHAAARGSALPRFAASGRGGAIALTRLVPAADGGEAPFFGRVRAMRAVLSWLRRPGSPALVVTGAPGSGKSALLAALCRSGDGSWGGWPDAFGRIDGFVDASRSTRLELMDRLRRACGAEDADAADPAALAAALGDRPRPLVVVVDGLDEAAEPDRPSLVGWLLDGLARTGRRTGLRVLVGARRDASVLGPATELVDLDAPGFADTDAVRRYTEALLWRTGATPLPTFVEALVHEDKALVKESKALEKEDIEAITRVAGGSFRLAEAFARGAGPAPARDWLPADGCWLRAARLPGSGPVALLAVTAGDDGTVRVWDALTGAELGVPTVREARPSAVGVAAVTDRVLVVAGGGDDTVRVWDVVTGKSVGGARAGAVSAVALTAWHGRALLASGDVHGAVRLWDVATGEPVGAPLTGHAGAVTAIAAAEIGGRVLIVSGGGDGAVRLWDPATGRGAEALRPAGGVAVSALTVWASAAPGDTGPRAILAAGHDGTVRRWSPPDWSAPGVAAPVPKAGRVHDVAVRDDGRLIVVTDAGVCAVRMPAAGDAAGPGVP
jgi:hypothetical protein